MNPSPKYTVLLPSRWGWFVGLRADPFQTGAIATMGEWSPDESQILRGFLRPGDTVVDVGANVGNHTMAFAAAVGDSGHVLAFEPQRYCYLCLCANIALNSLVHFVEPFQLAVGAEVGVIDVPILNPLGQMTNFGGVSLTDKHTSPTEKANCVTIDSLNLSALTLLKIDVEGMEPAVLRGAAQTINRFRPVIWSECLKDRGTKDELLAIFAELNYRAWWCATELFCQQNIRQCRHNLFTFPDGQKMQDHNVLALPAEKNPPPWTENAQPFA